MTFKYRVINRLTKKVIAVKDDFEDAKKKIVLSQDRGNMNKRLLILRARV